MLHTVKAPLIKLEEKCNVKNCAKQETKVPSLLQGIIVINIIFIVNCFRGQNSLEKCLYLSTYKNCLSL